MDFYEMFASMFGLGFFLFFVAFAVAVVVAQWKIFEKAGEPGYASLIPFYNSYILFKIVYGEGWKFLLCLIPGLNYIIAIAVNVRLAQVFGLSTVHQVLMVFLTPIEYLIIAFSDTRYMGYITSFL